MCNGEARRMVKIPNTNLLLGVGLLGVAYFIVKEVRSAGQDLFEALPTLDEGLRQSISDIAESTATTTQAIANLTSSFSESLGGIQQAFTDFEFPELVLPDFGNIFGQDDSSSIAGETVPFGDDGTTVTIPSDTTVNEDGIVTSSTSPTMNLSDEEREEALRQLELNRQRSIMEQELSEIPTDEILSPEILRAQNEVEYQRRLAEALQQQVVLQPVVDTPPPEIVSELTTNQVFSSGGPSFIGGTIRENPVDTLGEVIDLFPELSASQAADFLNEFSGISPSDAMRVDPDITNITANIGGENVQVQNVSVSDLDAAENRASCTTCELFGLNCERCQIEGLSN